MTKINVNTHDVADFKIERFIRNTKVLRVSLSLIVKTMAWWEELAWLVTAENLNLTLPAPIPDEEKNKLNFYFHTSLWCLKRVLETFRGTTKKCENKNLS